METTKTLERSLESSQLHRSKPGVHTQTVTMLLVGTIRPTAEATLRDDFNSAMGDQHIGKGCRSMRRRGGFAKRRG